MTRSEFFARVPQIVFSPVHGYGSVQIIADGKRLKGIWYRYDNEINEDAYFAGTWEELLKKVKDVIKLEDRTSDLLRPALFFSHVIDSGKF